MANKTFLFEVPMPETMIKNGLVYTRNLGNLQVSGWYESHDDYEIEEVLYNDKDIFPVLEYGAQLGDTALLDRLESAVSSHIQQMRYERFNY